MQKISARYTQSLGIAIGFCFVFTTLAIFTSTAKASSHFDPCQGLTGDELARCRIITATGREIIQKVVMSELAKETIERIRCIKAGNDIERCFGIYRIPPIPRPLPFVQELKPVISSINLEQRKKLFDAQLRSLENRQKLERQIVEQIWLGK